MWLNLPIKSRYADKVPQILRDIRAVSLPFVMSEPRSSSKWPFTDPMRVCTRHKNLGFLPYEKSLHSGKTQLSRGSQAPGSGVQGAARRRARALALGWAMQGCAGATAGPAASAPRAGRWGPLSSRHAVPQEQRFPLTASPGVGKHPQLSNANKGKEDVNSKGMKKIHTLKILTTMMSSRGFCFSS